MWTSKTGLESSMLLTFMLAHGSAFAHATPPVECFQFDKHVAAPPFAGPDATLDFSAAPAARRFRTVIREGAKAPANFAGYVRIVEWGCGISCQQFALVNKKTGRVDLVPIQAEVGAAFRLDSRLLVVNPPERVEGTPFNASRSFVWDDKSRSLKRLPSCDDDELRPVAAPVSAR